MFEEEVTIPLDVLKAKNARIVELEAALRLVVDAEDYDTIEAAKYAARDALNAGPEAK